MARKKKPLSARAERRAIGRSAVKLAQARIKLAEAEAGGSPARPIEVRSASVIETRALTHACLACSGTRLSISEHRALEANGIRVRAVDLRCSACGVERTLYFRLLEQTLN